MVQPSISEVVSSDWQQGLPTLRGHQVVLRELRASDATSLHALLTTEEVSRFILAAADDGRRVRAPSSAGRSVSARPARSPALR